MAVPVTTLKFARALDDARLLDNVLASLVVEPAQAFGPNLSRADGTGAFSQDEQVAMLVAWIAALTAPKVGLFVNAIAPTPDTVIGDLTQPIGSWYALKVAVLGEPFLQADGSVRIQAASLQFNYTGVDPGELIRGWFLQDTV